VGTWPGLADAQLFENRDLAPTTNLRALAMALLLEHLGVPAAAMPSVFPGSSFVSPQSGLLHWSQPSHVAHGLLPFQADQASWEPRC
jgi:uncharacterized protein (DUF1501 family)